MNPTREDLIKTVAFVPRELCTQLRELLIHDQQFFCEMSATICHFAEHDPMYLERILRGHTDDDGETMPWDPDRAVKMQKLAEEINRENNRDKAT